VQKTEQKLPVKHQRVLCYLNISPYRTTRLSYDGNSLQKLITNSGPETLKNVTGLGFSET